MTEPGIPDGAVDVGVVGAGPAGLAAALAAARAGARVALVDERPAPDGAADRIGAAAGGDVAALAERVRAEPRIAWWGETTVWGWFEAAPPTSPEGTGSRSAMGGGQQRGATRSGALLMRLALAQGERFAALDVRALVVATGAIDRRLPFPGWLLPGVLPLGEAWAGLGLAGLAGRRVLLAGSSPYLAAFAEALIAAGCPPLGVVEATDVAAGLGELDATDRRVRELTEQRRRIEAAGVPFLPRQAVVAAEGAERLERVVVAPLGPAGRPLTGEAPGGTPAGGSRQPGAANGPAVPPAGGGSGVPGSAVGAGPGVHRVELDALVVAFGALPSAELLRLIGCAFRFDPVAGVWLPETDESLATNVPGVWAAGVLAGVDPAGPTAAADTGALAGLAAARSLGGAPSADAGEAGELRRRLAAARALAAALGRVYAVPDALWDLATDATVVCSCEGVTAGAIREVAGFGGPGTGSWASTPAVKRWTRAGMGICQGRICGPAVAQLVARRSGRPVEAVDQPSVRAPIVPVSMRVLADGGRFSPPLPEH